MTIPETLQAIAAIRQQVETTDSALRYLYYDIHATNPSDVRLSYGVQQRTKHIEESGLTDNDTIEKMMISLQQTFQNYATMVTTEGMSTTWVLSALDAIEARVEELPPEAGTINNVYFFMTREGAHAGITYVPATPANHMDIELTLN